VITHKDGRKNLPDKMNGRRYRIVSMQVYRIETGKINTTICTVLALSKGLEILPKKLLEFKF